jgi:hypothetical protein
MKIKQVQYVTNILKTMNQQQFHRGGAQANYITI